MFRGRVCRTRTPTAAGIVIVRSDLWPQRDRAAGVVVVALNYRLGRLGFFIDPALTATGKHRPTTHSSINSALPPWTISAIGLTREAG